MRYLSFILVLALGSFTALGQNSKVTTAILSMQSNDLEKAVEAIDEAVQHPKTVADPKAWYYRGEIYTRIGSQPGKFPEKAPTAVDEAYLSYMNSMKYDEKGKWTNENLVGLDLVRQNYFNIGSTALQNKDYERCYDIFDRTQTIYKKIAENTEGLEGSIDTISMFYYAYAADQLGKKDEAKKIYEDLVKMRYEDKFLYDMLAQLYIDEEDYDNALKVVKTGQEVLPENIDLLITELNIYLKSGRATEAIDRFEKAIELNPDNADLYFALGTIYDNLHDKAIEEGNKEKEAEYRAKMVETYTGALKIDPEYFKATYNIGVMYFNEAIEVAKKMNELPLSDKEGYRRLEAERNDLFKQALPYLEKAHQLMPEDESTMKALREIYLRTNDMVNYKKMNDILEGKEGGE